MEGDAETMILKLQQHSYLIVDWDEATTTTKSGVFDQVLQYFETHTMDQKQTMAGILTHDIIEGQVGYRSGSMRERLEVRLDINNNIHSQNLPQELKLHLESLLSQYNNFALDLLETLLQEYMDEPLTYIKENIGRTTDDFLEGSIARFSYYKDTDDIKELPREQLNAHTDVGFLTLLPKSTLEGLFVFDMKSLEWIRIEEQMSDTQMLVMVGESLTWITNEQFPSTIHSVNQVKPGNRLSLVYLVRPLHVKMLSGKYMDISAQDLFVKISKLNSKMNVISRSNIPIAMYVESIYEKFYSNHILATQIDGEVGLGKSDNNSPITMTIFWNTYITDFTPLMHYFNDFYFLMKPNAIYNNFSCMGKTIHIRNIAAEIMEAHLTQGINSSVLPYGLYSDLRNYFPLKNKQQLMLWRKGIKMDSSRVSYILPRYSAVVHATINQLQSLKESSNTTLTSNFLKIKFYEALVGIILALHAKYVPYRYDLQFDREELDTRKLELLLENSFPEPIRTHLIQILATDIDCLDLKIIMEGISSALPAHIYNWIVEIIESSQ
eukprot:TRINITY_DN5892_c0_g1_i1.p1 TRINITY_DN5892_c0_g1~~TRINITY_DN5892_c0_g1_i1.p1  ORF type:complete len:551 (-),score=91.59 TRINITY_DN5892_c0_g1_i1:118-1770(-)